MPGISNRAGNVPLSPFRKLVPYADKAKAAGKKVYHLNIGQPDILTPASAIEQFKKIPMKVIAYSPAVGMASYRKKLAGYYERNNIFVDPDHIVVTTGASEAIQMLCFSLMDQGEELIVPEPFYANYNGFTQIADVKIRPITCSIEDGFALPSVEQFEELVNEKTKGIFITNPSNPTGTFYEKEVLEELAKLVKKHDLYLIIDEVYREFCFDGQEFFSALNLEGLEDHVIVVDSVSKRFSACGVRVGAIVTKNEAVLESITRYAKLRLSPPALGQMLSEAMLDNEEHYLREAKEEYDRRRMTVYRRLSAMPDVVSYKPGGAFYCFAKFPVKSAEHFCQWLLESFDYKGATVMLSPGEGFYATPGLGVDEVRIAFVLNSEDLESAMDCLEEALKVYPGRLKSKEMLEIGA
jgi:aspartate aminotransferase